MSEARRHLLAQDPVTVLGRDGTHRWGLECSVTAQRFFYLLGLENSSWEEFGPEESS